VRSDGTNLYFGDGTVIVSGSQTLVLATYSNAYTGSIPTILGYSLFAVRIA
jgi:autotransporter-associated beta strand protein